MGRSHNFGNQLDQTALQRLRLLRLSSPSMDPHVTSLAGVAGSYLLTSHAGLPGRPPPLAAGIRVLAFGLIFYLGGGSVGFHGLNPFDGCCLAVVGLAGGDDLAVCWLSG